MVKRAASFLHAVLHAANPSWRTHERDREFGHRRLRLFGGREVEPPIEAADPAARKSTRHGLAARKKAAAHSQGEETRKHREGFNLLPRIPRGLSGAAPRPSEVRNKTTKYGYSPSESRRAPAGAQFGPNTTCAFRTSSSIKAGKSQRASDFQVLRPMPGLPGHRGRLGRMTPATRSKGPAQVCNPESRGENDVWMSFADRGQFGGSRRSSALSMRPDRNSITSAQLVPSGHRRAVRRRRTQVQSMNVLPPGDSAARAIHVLEMQVMRRQHGQPTSATQFNSGWVGRVYSGCRKLNTTAVGGVVGHSVPANGVGGKNGYDDRA
ncbi:hypothetical protein C8R46DRAFT_1026539 [Mycena filopes]|nr:hypothetical protein C8R46DRAFT_1026539 [Mycena filopes]